MLRGLLARYSPFVGALGLAFGCFGDANESTGSVENVGEVELALAGAGGDAASDGGTAVIAAAGAGGTPDTGTSCVTDADCGNNVACGTCNTGSGKCQYANINTNCTSATHDASNPCDTQDKCDGAGTCVDNFAANTVVCQAADGVCNPADHCSGDATKTCVVDVAPDTTSCTSATHDPSNPCDAPDSCDGAGTCVDQVQDSSVVCDAGSGVCDPDDLCSGDSTKTCVVDVAPDTTSCTSATHDPSNPCDAPDFCDGAGACQDRVADTSVVCLAGSGVCNPDDTCSGDATKTCVVDLAPDTTSCTSATHDPSNPCDAPDFCDGAGACQDRVADTSVVCLAGNGVCDPDDTCSGDATKTCEVDLAPNTTSCTSATHQSGNPCDAPDLCDGAGTCVDHFVTDTSTVCLAGTGVCDPADTCSGGSDKTCVQKLAPNTTNCTSATDDPANPCDARDKCDGAGLCVDLWVTDATTVCKSANGVCDPEDFCSGTDETCVPSFAALGTGCDSGTNGAQPCEAADTCNGAGTCIDRVQAAGVVCDPDDGPCEENDTCDGVTKVCAEKYAPADTDCDDGVECTTEGTSQCNATGVCEKGTPDDSLCPQSGDPQAECATWECDQNLGCQPTYFSTNFTCRFSAGPCDVEEKCDGVTPTCPSDDLRSLGHVCQAASCDPATNTSKQQIACTGSDAACPIMGDVSCGFFRCNSALTACRTSCTTSEHCIASHYCDSGTCLPRINAGGSCANDAECSTSNPYCVDGVCCDARCNGQCESCNQAGFQGACQPRPAGSQPSGEREACAGEAGSTCQGSCDGTSRTSCAYPGVAVQCREASCDTTTNVALESAFCDGAGLCAADEPMSCSPFICGATACLGDCSADSDCVGNAYCRAGVCTERLADGGQCTRAAQCQSGFCVDGVCCDTRCDGQCEACNQEGERGSCAAVSGNPVGARPACAGSGDCAGTCDGALRSACSYPGLEQACRGASCADGVATLGARCDGGGECPAAQTVQCDQGCEGSICAGDACTIDAECAATEYCAAGMCLPKQQPGAICSDGGDCASGFCADGVCCDSACVGQCEACNVAGSEGTCAPVPGGELPRGARPACTSDGSDCGGACDGQRRDGCDYPTGNICRAGSCDASTDGASAIVEATCQGDGRCPAEQQQACGAVGCAGDLCDGECADGSACAPGEYCSAGICVQQRPDGASCAGGGQCESGQCVDGVCCNSACTGQCEACDVPGALGTCSAVSGATHGGRAACSGSGPCGAQCDGASRTACGFAAEGSSCGPAFCADGVSSEGQLCDGAGSCGEGETTVCPSLSCDGTSCSTSCTSDADCTGENYCLDGACQPSSLIDAVDEGTCGCRVPGAPSASGRWFALVGLFGAALWFRRRRAA